MKDIPEIEELIKLISKLPGLGPKSARRIVLKLINNKQELHKPMVNSMATVFKNVSRCGKCGTLIPGHFDLIPGRWGRRRKQVKIGI